MARLAHVLAALLVALDIVGCVLWLSPLYLVGLADQPTGRETISAYVGMSALNGRRWALRAARVIDWGAKILVGQEGHCAESYRYWQSLMK